MDFSPLDRKWKLDYKKLLNREQQRVLLSDKGQYLVIAGAGSGKTRTIIYRVAWFLENGIDESKILMITFTRKASFEMQERLRNILNRKINCTITTFHSFCANLIVRHKEIFKIEKLNILKEEESKKILEFIIKRLNLEKEINIFSIDRVYDFIIKDRFKREKKDEILGNKKLSMNILKIKSEYKAYKKYKGFFEFDDLIEIVVEKLRFNKDFLLWLRKRFLYIVVDEYQDSNYSQRELIKLLVGEEGNLMVVGDDYQSIYGFRGADYKNILNFGEDFPNGKLLKLEKNYRSSDEIIEFTNRIAQNFKVKYRKEIFGCGKKGGDVFIGRFEDEKKEGEFICKKILEFVQEGMKLSDIAILYRSRYTVECLEKILGQNGINYYKNEEKKGEMEGVAIFSVHSAKGLEWEVVFIPTMLEGVFPIKLEGTDVEEEKRVFYVACSRGKKKLFLTYPKFHYGKLGYFDKKSSFIS